MDDPVTTFLARRRAAIAAGAPLGGYVAVLATATPDGRPSARAVLVKEVEHGAFYVYTNYGSRKSVELDANPHAALCMHWPEIGEQFRIEGPVERVSAERSDAYFAARPRESQIGAWASPQSRVIASRAELVLRAEALTAAHEGAEVPRPDDWGGYRLVATRIEHWVDREARLHDRRLYERGPEGWTSVRLAP